jgi:hypothetical protein
MPHCDGNRQIRRFCRNQSSLAENTIFFLKKYIICPIYLPKYFWLFLSPVHFAVVQDSGFLKIQFGQECILIKEEAEPGVSDFRSEKSRNVLY